MAIKPWELIVASALGAGFFLYMWKVRRAASPDKLLGEVQDVRRTGLWALESGRLLVIRHDTHNTPAVRLQFRKPGTTGALQFKPAQALRIASLLRQAVEQAKAPFP